MAVLRRIGMVVAALAVVVAVVPAFLPSSYHVERAVAIQASPETIHALVDDLTAWERWSPWSDAPTGLDTLAPANGPGARRRWIGTTGDGELTLTASDPAYGIAYEMAIDGGRYVSSGAIRYTPSGDGTTVTWTMEGDAKGWLGRYFVAMTDRMVGPTFERGLERLRTVAESDAVSSRDAP